MTERGGRGTAIGATMNGGVEPMESMQAFEQRTWTPLQHEDLQARVRSTLARLSQTGALPTLPAAASAALGMARDPEADIDDLCRVIQTDVGLSARVLRIANSAALGRRNPARKLQEAVITLGLRKTCDILVAACAKRLYEGATAGAEELWNHSLAVAVACEELARTTRRVEVGCAFLPGLFHDVGRAAFLLADGTAAEVIESLAVNGTGERSYLEREWYGFDHAEAGAILAEDWGLALELCDAIRWHHEPTEAGAARELATLLNAADAFAYRIGCGTGSEAPPSVGTTLLGLGAEDEHALADRIQGAWSEQRDLLG
ncbi:MAG: HDOD domain-containing protein [Deltaproteobacteria bacterium]|nr:HDOD domain-containing protein [Deltaproteobacteria bacterium]